MRLRKLAFVLAFLTAVVGGTGIGIAQPPGSDPTCEHAPEDHPRGAECPGDNGAEQAEDALCDAPSNPGTDLARDIVEAGPDAGDC